MDAGTLLDILGNENRRRILELLSRKPCYVTEISEHLDVSPKAVIDHLRKLEDAGLIKSRNDDNRRKYFHISQNLRLEVTVAPYAFGMKSAYPASPNLDLSSCKYLSVDARSVNRRRPPTRDAGVDGPSREAGLEAGEADARPLLANGTDIVSLAHEIEELDVLSRELSLAQRWVQGRTKDALDNLLDAFEDGDYLDAEILVTVAKHPATTGEISEAVNVPVPVVHECLNRLREAGLVRRGNDGWSVR